jgi:hypothetical protein
MDDAPGDHHFPLAHHREEERRYSTGTGTDLGVDMHR